MKPYTPTSTAGSLCALLAGASSAVSAIVRPSCGQRGSALRRGEEQSCELICSTLIRPFYHRLSRHLRLLTRTSHEALPNLERYTLVDLHLAHRFPLLAHHGWPILSSDCSDSSITLLPETTGGDENSSLRILLRKLCHRLQEDSSALPSNSDFHIHIGFEAWSNGTGKREGADVSQSEHSIRKR